MQGRSEKRGTSPSRGSGEKKEGGRKAESVEKDPWLPSSSYSSSSSTQSPRAPPFGGFQRPFAFSSRSASSQSSFCRSGAFSGPSARAPGSFSHSSHSSHSSRPSSNPSNSSSGNPSFSSPRLSHSSSSFSSSRNASPFSGPSSRSSRPSRPPETSGSSASRPPSSFSSSEGQSSSRPSRRVSTSGLPSYDPSSSNSTFFPSSYSQVSHSSASEGRHGSRTGFSRSSPSVSSPSSSPPPRKGRREEKGEYSFSAFPKKTERGNKEPSFKRETTRGSHSASSSAEARPRSPPGGHALPRGAADRRDEEKGKRREEERGRKEDERGRKEDERGKKEEERGKKEEERGRKEDERGKKEEDRGKKEEERVKKADERGRKEDERGKKEEERGRKEEERGRKEDERGKKEEDRGKQEEERVKKEDERGKGEDERGKKEEERGRLDRRSKEADEEEKRRRGEERAWRSDSTEERRRGDEEEKNADKREERRAEGKRDQAAYREREGAPQDAAAESNPEKEREGREEGKAAVVQRKDAGNRDEAVAKSGENGAGGNGAVEAKEKSDGAEGKKEKASEKTSRNSKDRERGGRKSCEESKREEGDTHHRLAWSSIIRTKEPRALSVNQWIGARLGHNFHPGKIISIRSLHSPGSSLQFPTSPARRQRPQRGGRTCPSCSKYVPGDSASPMCRRCGAAGLGAGPSSSGRRSETAEVARGGRGKSARADTSPTSCGSMTAVGGQDGTPEGAPGPGEGERVGKGKHAREEDQHVCMSRAVEIEKPHHYEYYIHYRHTNRRLDTWLKFDDLRPITQEGRVLEYPVLESRRRKRKRGDRGDRWAEEGEDADDETETKRRREDKEGVSVSDSDEDESWEPEAGAEGEDSDWEMLNKLAMFDPSVQFSDHDEEAAKEHEGMDLATLQAHEEATKIKTIRQIQFGPFRLHTWYFSPYPAHVQDAEVLHVCEFCLSFFRHASELATHNRRCILRHPPGDEIYRDGRLSVFEVDGSVARVYSENLCFLAKLFLDHKTLQYDVEPFLFYVLTEVDHTGCHLIGYFSKEKISLQAYNLACILTLPQHQRKGYGRFLISFSYLLSLREKKKGGPERPLSDLGRLSYVGWWTWCLLTHLESDEQKRKRKISIEDLVRNTAVREEDIQRTLEEIGVLRYVQGHHLLLLHPDLVKHRLKEAGSGGVLVHGENLRFVSYHRTPPAPREALPVRRAEED
nr:TPA: histone lysine acetyltransferase MYST-B [Neospora caninum Liverpool]